MKWKIEVALSVIGNSETDSEKQRYHNHHLEGISCILHSKKLKMKEIIKLNFILFPAL